jgi:hypothetical protein
MVFLAIMLVVGYVSAVVGTAAALKDTKCMKSFVKCLTDWSDDFNRTNRYTWDTQSVYAPHRWDANSSGCINQLTLIPNPGYTGPK